MDSVPAVETNPEPGTTNQTSDSTKKPVKQGINEDNKIPDSSESNNQKPKAPKAKKRKKPKDSTAPRQPLTGT